MKYNSESKTWDGSLTIEQFMELLTYLESGHNIDVDTNTACRISIVRKGDLANTITLTIVRYLQEDGYKKRMDNFLLQLGVLQTS